MTPTCPDGHASVSTDYCEVCGLAMPDPSRPGPEPQAGPDPQATVNLPALDDDDADTSTRVPPQPCPKCGATRLPSEVVCENCGHHFRTETSAAEWEVIIRPDRRQFDRVAEPGLQFPHEVSEQRLVLEGELLRIGRSPGAGGGTGPEIAIADPGVSSKHAELKRRPDGAYAVRDVGSTNGTTLGEGFTPVADIAIDLSDGDVIRIGAWTAITVHSL